MGWVICIHASANSAKHNIQKERNVIREYKNIVFTFFNQILVLVTFSFLGARFRSVTSLALFLFARAGNSKTCARQISDKICVQRVVAPHELDILI